MDVSTSSSTSILSTGFDDYIRGCVDWKVMIKATSGLQFEEFRKKLPKNAIYQTSNTTSCKCCHTKHNWKQQYSKCSIEGCEVQYKFFSCSVSLNYIAVMNGEHHHIEQSREMSESKKGVPRGIAQAFKDIIDTMSEMGINNLTTKRHEENICPDIPLPELFQVQGYMNRNRDTPKRCNDIVPVMDYIEKLQFNANLQDCDPFIFGVPFDEQGKPIVGDGKFKPVRICMTSKLLLQRLDDSDQNGCGIYHIDIDVKRLAQLIYISNSKTFLQFQFLLINYSHLFKK